MRAVVLLALMGMTLSLSAAPAPLPRRERGDRGALQGEWKLIQYRNDKAEAWGGMLSVRGDRLQIRISELKMELHATVAFPMGRTSQAIDVQFYLERRATVNVKMDEVALSIYRIEGDVLTLSMGDRRNRPGDFNRGSGEVWVFRRLSR